jgi:hypothetical protein
MFDAVARMLLYQSQPDWEVTNIKSKSYVTFLSFRSAIRNGRVFFRSTALWDCDLV